MTDDYFISGAEHEVGIAVPRHEYAAVRCCDKLAARAIAAAWILGFWPDMLTDMAVQAGRSAARRLGGQWGRSAVLAALAVALSMSFAASVPAQQQLKKAQEATAPARRTVLRFFTTVDFPPFNYLDEDGVLTGFNVDLARAICFDLNVTCNITARSWESLFAGLQRRQGDAVIAGHVVSARALAQIDFTDRYFHTPGRFVGRRGGDELQVTPDGLDGRRIGVAKGTTHEAFLLAFFRNSAIVRFETQELARDGLMTGKADLVFDDGVSLILWINGELSKGCCELKGGPYLEPKYFGDGIAIAVAKNDSQLRNDLNASLRRLRASGRFEELVLRYFPYRVF